MRQHRDDTEVAEIIKQYEDGVPVVRIAEAQGVNPSTIHRIISRAGVKKKNTALSKVSNKRLTEAETAKVLQMYKEGAIIEQIMEDVGCSAPTVYTVIKKQGLSRSSKADPEQVQTAIQMHSSKKYSVQEILDRTGLSKATFYRKLKEYKGK